MNDNELITLMKEPFADVHMTVPPDEVIRHGRAVRSRRRLRGLTGAVALAGAAVVAVALLVPGGHPATARLAAWAVARDPDGGITVTVNQMKDPAGLQATLRADGVPARVTFDPLNWLTQPLPAGCTAPKMSDQANAQLQSKILLPPAVWSYQQQMRAKYVQAKPNDLTKPAKLQPNDVLPKSLSRLMQEGLYINPAAIPAGIGLSIGVDVSSSGYSYGVDLVVTNSQCTGSS
jgi:hypothetical protein